MRTLIWLSICGLVSSQMFFPEERNIAVTNPQYNYNAQSGSGFNAGYNSYESMVDGIIAKGIDKLTLSIAKSLTNSDKNSECNVFAPINIAGALAMVLLGSSGRTFQEVANVMGLATGVDIHSKSQLVHSQFGRMMRKLDQVSSFDLGDEVTLANALFVQENFPIRDVYRRIAQNDYRSEILSVDFMRNAVNAKTTINNWVNDRTKGKITEMLEDIPPADTRVIITAALYFKAAWEHPFFVDATKLRPFYSNGKQASPTKYINMMTNGGYFPYYRDNILNCQILGFPYKGNRSAMFVILPNDSNKEKLVNLQRRLTDNDLERLVSSTVYKKSIIMFPKMKLESTIDLKNSLQDLGIHSLFMRGQSNLGLLSPGLGGYHSSYPGFGNHFGAPGMPAFEKQGNGNKNGHMTNILNNPRVSDDDDDPPFIFSRISESDNYTDSVNTTNADQKTVRKRDVYSENLDSLRSSLTENDNPGLYVDQVIHKVHMDITELGTEAAASTSVSLTRSGDYVRFNANVPFLFFVWNYDTKIVMFWGTVTTPSPNYDNEQSA